VHEAGVIALGIALIRLLSLLAFRVLFPRLGVQAPRIAEDIVATIGYVAWAVVRLRVAGVDFAGIVTASAVITAVIAFSMQDTLGNILGGIALQLDESLQIGDWIKVDELSGRVTEVRWRSTSVATRNGEIVVLPNSVLMKNRFLVLGRRDDGPPQWRRWIRFEAPGDVPPARVIDAVGEELRSAAIAGVAADPAPDCLLMGLDGGLCQYAVRYWLTDLLRDDGTDSRVRVHVHAALRRAGIALALPQYRLRTINEDAAFEATRSRRETERRIEALRGAELFRGLTDEERETLAARLVYAPYAAGDMVTRKGAVAHWLYIITRGQARVSIDLPDGSQREVNLLGAGDFFGEMALMTGAPRRANVSAASDLECYRLDKQSFADLIHARPAIADEVSHVLAERQAALEALQQGVTASPQQVAHQRNELLEKVRRFFSIGED
jgi:small-conductance mechanosensitive channel/CRP-like cAMP-binding protein